MSTPRLTPQDNLDYRRVEKALRYLAEHRRAQPSLDDLAEALELSPFHMQRLFQRCAGVSPKRFLQFLTKEHARALLQAGHSTVATAAEVGLSGSGRLHDLMVVTEALTPGEVKTGGDGVELRYGAHPTPFGPCLVVCSQRGVVALEFVEALNSPLPTRVRERWPRATLRKDRSVAKPVMERIFGKSKQPLKVWQALRQLAPGEVTSYGQLARAMGEPRAARAVGRAMGQNPVGLLIPCHRVIHSLGDSGAFRWGPERKRAMLAWEAAQLP